MKNLISWFHVCNYRLWKTRCPEADTAGLHVMEAPDNSTIELFVIRVGEWGGYMLWDCDDPLAVHKFRSMLPAFEFQVRPVVPVMDAVRVELEAIAFAMDSNANDIREYHVTATSCEPATLVLHYAGTQKAAPI